MIDNLLESKTNRYQGCWITSKLPNEPSQFEKSLIYSLNIWKKKELKIVWLTIEACQAHLIPIALSQGFSFHHVNSDALILTKQLIKDAFYPNFAHHTIGVGGIVFNDNNEILTIVEKHDIQDRPGHWKFPGGTVDKGELAREAVVREIFEETGIISRFENMIGLRHYHRGQFGTSNIYMVCRLKAITHKIIPCPEEIGQAKWFGIEQYLACDTVIEFNKALLKAALTGQGLHDINLGELHGTPSEAYEIFISDSYNH